ncbi:SDR family oxidoreductase [Thiobaca trueperi]|uniref:Short-subunit dehydrogenase n=1 Tax=Thiobaca trueperi TaxID=127458 RepID=A0A4R3MT11_9GAMM|nr:SDR family NAD(P)-dependent oxidoreductase [Thiobaca trueperi]TCT18867.1 short-subunit dehydrogenase [Thiobaca trueperi]
MQDFKGRTVIVTGATGHLGQATARAFAARGASLALVARDPAGLAEARQRLGVETDVATFAVDLLQPPAVSAMVDQVIARFGGLHALVNLAGGFAMGPAVHDTTDQDWELMMDLNMHTPLNCVRAAIPRFLEAGAGRIVNVSARAAIQGSGHMAPYCVAKAAVITLTESLADELRHTGITVNCVLPGTLDTPPNRAAMPDANHDTWVSLDALADVILFLASDAARAITGASIPVYGRS